jgi:hypothetical protein
MSPRAGPLYALPRISVSDPLTPCPRRAWGQWITYLAVTALGRSGDGRGGWVGNGNWPVSARSRRALVWGCHVNCASAQARIHGVVHRDIKVPGRGVSGDCTDSTTHVDDCQLPGGRSGQGRDCGVCAVAPHRWTARRRARCRDDQGLDASSARARAATSLGRSAGPFKYRVDAAR